MKYDGQNSSEILGVLGFEPAQEAPFKPAIYDQPASTPAYSPINRVSAQPESVMIGGVEHWRIPKNTLQAEPRRPLPIVSSEAWDFSIGADHNGAINVHGSGNAESVIEAMRRIVSPQIAEGNDAVTVDVRSERQRKWATAKPIEVKRDSYVAVVQPTKNHAPRVKRALIIGGLALTTLTSFNASTGRLSPTDMAANVKATLAAPITMFNSDYWLIKKVH